MKYAIQFSKTEDVTEFVDIVNKFECDVDVMSGRHIVDGKSLMGVTVLSRNTDLEMYMHSDDCEAMLEKIRPYLKDQNQYS